jgi:hypothetical protein
METNIATIRQTLSLSDVAIPEYQRPYKWSVKNVNALLDDILHFSSMSKYRLGTIVYHCDKQNNLKYIVDGQQRSITLALIALAIYENQNILELVKKDNFQLPVNKALDNFEFKHPISQENIRNNYREIQRRIVDFSMDTIRFFFDNCEVVTVELLDISEAFQFFDSQNARGRDLDPHDLLKAFHLREISADTPEKVVMNLVANWEDMNSQNLTHSFSNYLYRIRSWSKGFSARNFTKNDVDSFKGISPNIKEPFPYADMYRIAHFYIEGYNREFHRNIDGHLMTFPFQLDQAIINGQRFFEFVSHYSARIEQIRKNYNSIPNLNNESIAIRILNTINSYDARNRTGDQYVRNLFDTAFVYYVDKFGYVDIERAIEKIFIWSYSLRLKRQSVQLASMDNYALEYPFIFKSIREALQPADFLNISLPLIQASEYKESNGTGKLNEIVEKFNELKYVI